MQYKQYFYLERIPKTEKYRIKCNKEYLGLDNLVNLEALPARLLGMSYCEWLNWCKELFSSEILGTNTLYPYPVFYRDELARRLIKILNYRLTLVLELK